MSLNRSTDDLDALADRLRGLPEAPVPAGLEERLIAAIPAARPRRWARLWLASALAAAVLLAVLLGRFLGKTDQTPTPKTPEIVEKRPPTHDESTPSGRAHADLASLPSSFEWPVQMPVPVGHRVPDELTD